MRAACARRGSACKVQQQGSTPGALCPPAARCCRESASEPEPRDCHPARRHVRSRCWVQCRKGASMPPIALLAPLLYAPSKQHLAMCQPFGTVLSLRIHSAFLHSRRRVHTNAAHLQKQLYPSSAPLRHAPPCSYLCYLFFQLNTHVDLFQVCRLPHAGAPPASSGPCNLCGPAALAGWCLPRRVRNHHACLVFPGEFVELSRRGAALAAPLYPPPPHPPLQKRITTIITTHTTHLPQGEGDDEEVPALSLSGALFCLTAITLIVTACSGAPCRREVAAGAPILPGPGTRPVDIAEAQRSSPAPPPAPPTLPNFLSPALFRRISDRGDPGGQRQQRHQRGLPGPHRAAHRRQRGGARHGAAGHTPAPSAPSAAWDRVQHAVYTASIQPNARS